MPPKARWNSSTRAARPPWTPASLSLAEPTAWSIAAPVLARLSITCDNSLRTRSLVPARAPTEFSALRLTASRRDAPDTSTCSVRRFSKAPMASRDRLAAFSAALRNASLESATSDRN